MFIAPSYGDTARLGCLRVQDRGLGITVRDGDIIIVNIIIIRDGDTANLGCLELPMCR